MPSRSSFLRGESISVMTTLTEEVIAKKLRRACRPGRIASTDGVAPWPEDAKLRCAAVLMPLAWFADEWHLLFTRRTDAVAHHKGQVSFPGGACDADEATPEATALREADEEIGLRPRDVRLLGRLNDMVTITGYRVTPVAGVIPWPYKFIMSPREVSRVFAVPLSWLARRENWEERMATPKGILRAFPVIIYRPYDGEIVWGATARMTLIFLKVLGFINK
jgi:8-oxo-dGTP pyrophosphatase MutT (NUDIX family)